MLKGLLESSDKERRLMSYEIHDGLAQLLSGATMQFQAFERLQGSNAEEATEAYGEGVRLLRQSVSEARRLISGLRPPIIDEMGIVLAIEHLVTDTIDHGGPKIEFFKDVEFERLDPLLENALFCIARESLLNACRHSESNEVQILLARRDGCVRIEIQDWGIGFDPKEVKEHCFGLAGISERARVFGGHATIDSAPGKGTRIAVELPVATG